MKFVVATTTLCLALAAVPSAQAGELHRYSIVYGPAGVTTGYTDRACYDGMCTYEHQVTGPYGYSVGKSAVTTEVAPGVYERSVTRTGPHGASFNRFATITVNR